MSEWRVTTATPLRDVDGLDHERCAALHNLIVERGWAGCGRDLALLDRSTWWECFGGDEGLGEHAAKLEPSVVEFLKSAWHGFAHDRARPPHAFCRHLAGLSPPDALWDNAMYDEAAAEDDGDKRRYVTLYVAGAACQASHPLGLVLDQDDFTAMPHASVHSSTVTTNGRQRWLPLELILEAFLDMIDHGKTVAVGDDHDGEQEQAGPWIMPSFTEEDVRDSLEAFARLVQAVEARMPQPPSQSQDVAHGLLGWSESDDSSPTIAAGFAHRFLSQARRPRNFRFIAPGLCLATHQPFAAVPRPPDTLRPVLLFEAPGRRAHQDTARTPWGEDVPISPFRGDLGSASECPAGLYLTETKPHGPHPFENGCKLLLPYPIGGNRLAVKSDGSLIGEQVEHHGSLESTENAPRSGELFQQGYNHFIDAHDVQLQHILWRWVELVEAGQWEVNADGVVGGIEKWQEADVEGHWEDYVLPMRW